MRQRIVRVWAVYTAWMECVAVFSHAQKQSAIALVAKYKGDDKRRLFLQPEERVEDVE